MVHPYLKRRQGCEEAACLHPSLEPVLERTLGVPLFQEQLLRMAMIAAEFHRRRSRGAAPRDGLQALRRAHAGNRSQAAQRHDANGIVGETQDQIVQSITSFALYGFPESHAASFALIAYASAYLKCHYLAAFTAAMLNNQPMGFYHPATLVKDAQRHGLHFLPVDVQQSQWKCTLDDQRPVAVSLGIQLRARRAERDGGGDRRRAAVLLPSTIWCGAFPAAQRRTADAGGDRRVEFPGRSIAATRCGKRNARCVRRALCSKHWTRH